MMNSVSQNFQKISLSGGFKSISSAFTNIFSVLTKYSGNLNFWIFMIIGVFLALHMNLSGADIKGAMSGLLFVLLAMLILNVVFYLIGSPAMYNSAVIGFAAILNTVLFLSLLISIIAVIISFIIKFTIGKKLF